MEFRDARRVLLGEVIALRGWVDRHDVEDGFTSGHRCLVSVDDVPDEVTRHEHTLNLREENGRALLGGGGHGACPAGPVRPVVAMVELGGEGEGGVLGEGVGVVLSALGEAREGGVDRSRGGGRERRRHARSVK